jgi:hypothetical protein
MIVPGAVRMTPLAPYGACMHVDFTSTDTGFCLISVHPQCTGLYISAVQVVMQSLCGQITVGQRTGGEGGGAAVA